MKTNAELDKWAAEKCGVDTCASIYDDLDTALYISNTNGSKIWTLSDARCREIVMEFFEISTNRGHWHEGKEWEHWFATTDDNKFEADGESIEAAEIACIQAIKDAEGE